MSALTIVKLEEETLKSIYNCDYVFKTIVRKDTLSCLMIFLRILKWIILIVLF